MRRQLPAGIGAAAASAWIALLTLSSSPASAVDVDPARLRAWSDEYFSTALAQRRFNGAVLTVVQGGQTLLLQGYGYEDWGRRVPIDPSTTQVRICSNSKTFTATAVLQLLDEGRIATLDASANTYLRRFHLPRVDDREITLLNLLTHRSGLAQGRFNEEAADASGTRSTDLDFRRLLGGFSNTPGEVSSYANSGAAVLGAVIEDVSGETFAGYLTTHIFRPLGMTSTLVVANDAPPRRLARPYRYFPSGAEEPLALFGKHPVYAPSGGVVSTAADMARFIAAHADEGRTARDPLLRPATYQRMHTQVLSNHPALDGFGLQYFTSRSRGERVAFHTCSLPGFSSVQAVFPESDTGVFIAVVAEEPRAAWWEYALAGSLNTRMSEHAGVLFNEPLDASDALAELRTILNLPVELPPTQAAAGHDAEDYSGMYITDRRPVGSMLSLAAAISNLREVSPGAGGTLRIGGRDYRQIAPDVFQRVDDEHSRLAFLRDGEGRVARLVGVSSSATRVGWMSNPALAVQVILWGAVVALSGIAALWWPASAARERVGKWAMALLAAAAAVLVWSVAFGFESSRGVNDISDAIGLGQEGRLWAVLIAADVIAIVGLTMLATVVSSWYRQWWGPDWKGIARRTHFTTLAIVAASMLVFLVSFHVIGVRPTPSPWPASQEFEMSSEHPFTRADEQRSAVEARSLSKEP